MLRSELISGTNEILTAIEQSAILRALVSRSSQRAEAPDRLIAALHTYGILAANFSEPGRQVADVMELTKLQDTTIWMKLIAGDDDQFVHIRSRLRFVTKELPQLIELLVQHTPASSEDQADGTEVVQIRLFEEDSKFSTVRRVLMALSACEELYDSLARLETETVPPLSVGAVDSGSDKAFDLFGAASVMKEFRQLILSIWDLVVFHRERKLGRQLDLIAAALPILERIKKLEDSGKLGKEEAAIIKNGIMDGTKNFLEAGVTMDEMGQHISNPRQLLAPEQKLLSAPTSELVHPKETPVPKTPNSSGSPPDAGAFESPGSLSEVDIERIAAAMRKQSLTPTQPPSSTGEENGSD